MRLEWMVRDCIDGNKQCFRLLYDATKDGVFRLVRARVGSRDEALDILQDTYLDLWRALSGGKFVYHSDGEFLAFLCAIARRKTARFYRFRPANVSLEDMEDLAAESQVDEAETLHVLSSLNKLPSLDREVMRLRYFEGLELKEIARLLKTGEDAIKTRHHRAIAKLRKLLGYEKEN